MTQTETTTDVRATARVATLCVTCAEPLDARGPTIGGEPECHGHETGRREADHEIIITYGDHEPDPDRSVLMCECTSTEFRYEESTGCDIWVRWRKKGKSLFSSMNYNMLSPTPL